MIFVIRSFLICLWLNVTVKAYWKQLLWSFVRFIIAFFYFSAIWKNLYTMIWFFSDLLFEDDDAINKKKLASFHWFFFFLISLQKKFKKFFNNFICFTTHHDFYIITFCLHSTDLIRIFRWNRINWHCYLNFPFSKLSFVIRYSLLEWTLKFLGVS